MRFQNLLSGSNYRLVVSTETLIIFTRFVESDFFPFFPLLFFKAKIPFGNHRVIKKEKNNIK